MMSTYDNFNSYTIFVLADIKIFDSKQELKQEQIEQKGDTTNQMNNEIKDIQHSSLVQSNSENKEIIENGNIININTHFTQTYL